MTFLTVVLPFDPQLGLLTGPLAFKLQAWTGVLLRMSFKRRTLDNRRASQVSEFKRPVFDPRLGGAAQLLRLRLGGCSVGAVEPNCFVSAGRPEIFLFFPSMLLFNVV